MKKTNKKNNFYIYLITFILCLFLSFIIYFIVRDNNKTISSTNEGIYDNEYQNDDIFDATVKPFVEDKILKVSINGVEYDMTLENNMTAYDLLSIVPITLNMEDLNNNEKYGYLSFSLNDEDSYVEHISKGDVMLYQTNCIVIFYQDVDTTYPYTKLGHIDNLPEFSNESINVVINK